MPNDWGICGRAAPPMLSHAPLRPVKTQADCLIDQNEYVVSPSRRLLSTSVHENAWACGSNTHGQLGLPDCSATSTDALVPVVQGPGTGGWAVLNFGTAHGAGISGDGCLFTWGVNNRGQCGHGENASSSYLAPTQVRSSSSKGAGTKYKAVACGHEHTVAITADHSLVSWGSNHHGQLGHGPNATMHVVWRPAEVMGLNRLMIAQVVCGRGHTLCVTAQSQVYAWGANSSGQLGLADRQDRNSPTLVDGLWALPVAQLAAGDEHSLALTANGHVFAWGSNTHWQLGLPAGQDGAAQQHAQQSGGAVKERQQQREQKQPRPHERPKSLPSNAAGTAASSSTYGTGSSATAAPGAAAEAAPHAGSARSTHINQAFLLAMMDMGIPKHQAELALLETGNTGVEVAAEWLFSTPEHELVALACKAAAAEPASAVDDLAAEPVPAEAVEEAAVLLSAAVLEPRRLPLKGVRAIAAGAAHTVAVADGGVVYSWGDGLWGALGHGDTEPRELPSRIEALEGVAVERVACGSHHTLLLATDGSVYGCGACGAGQLTQRTSQMGLRLGDSSAVMPTPVKLTLPFAMQRVVKAATGIGSSKVVQQVVYDVVGGPGVTGIITRAVDEVPPTNQVDLLATLQTAVSRAQSARVKGDASALAKHMRSVTTGLEAVMGSAAALNAAFGNHDGVGIDVGQLDSLLQAIMQLVNDKLQPSGDGDLGSTLADLQQYSTIQALLRSHNQLLEDLSSRARLLGTPERAQVLLAAAQHPLLSDHAHAKQLLPKLCSTILSAPSATRQLLVKWWSDYPPQLLADRVVKPLQGFVTKELLTTKKLTSAIMNCIKVLSRVEEANQINRLLPPEAFYNQLISDKMDVQDHYTAWRQTQDMMPQGAPTRSPAKPATADAPFSFCSYPFLLDARAKSNLLHIEARFQMEQTVAHARMEAQLYGGSARQQHHQPSPAAASASAAAASSAATASFSSTASQSAAQKEDDARVLSAAAKLQLQQRQEAGAGASTSGRDTGKHSAGGAYGKEGRGGKPARRRGGGDGVFRSLLMTLLRPSSRPSSGRSPRENDTLPTLDQSSSTPRHRHDSFSLPKPSECPMPGTHSDMCIVRVRRTHLLEDALAEISRQNKRDLFKPLRVHFIGEEGIDAGGVKKEFFQLLMAELLSPDYGMLVPQPESNTFWFNAATLEPPESFLLLGLLLGLAVYNRVLLDFPLPIAAYKKLLGQTVGLRELEEMQPTLGRSLRSLLKFEGPGSVEDTFCLTFSHEEHMYGGVREVDLKEGGASIAVTEANRHEYVELLVSYLLNTSVAPFFEHFATGFRMLCDGPAVRLFNPQEIERLVCGNPNLDFDALQRNAKYEAGYKPDTPVVMWLWDIVRKELSLEEKKRFLKFFTGTDRAPIGGLGTLRCLIQRDGSDSSKLPTSHTCFNTLLLPEYDSRAKLARLLRLAIMNSEGFGLE